MTWTRGAGLMLACVILSGCGGEPTGAASDEVVGATAASRQAASALSAAQNSDIAALRSATAAFHRVEVAQAAGYGTQFPAGCFTSDEGAMGFHYLNGTNVGSLEVTRPQLLMYEPQANGTMRLVGVEFIKPGVRTDEPPVLFGRSFSYNPVFEVWVLHVWAWAHNPDGVFADWNPRITCANAAVVSATSHH